MKLGIDLETFSPENLKLSGLYRYALNPEFDILLFGYSLDGEAPVVLDCTKTNDRLELMELAPLIYNPGCIKTAYNAAFEWYCLSVYLNRYKKLNGLLPVETLAGLFAKHLTVTVRISDGDMYQVVGQRRL